MHNHIELLKVIKKILKDPLYSDSSTIEILRDFSRGSFGMIISDKELESLGGKEEVQKQSKEILAETKIINSINNNNEKTSKK